MQALIRGGDRDVLGGQLAPDDVAHVLRRRRGGGSVLPSTVASSMSAGFGVDVSSLRVHTGPEAASVSRRLPSTAFAYGRDLCFSAGAYQPHTAPGRELLAHEIAHTMQPGGASTGPTVGRAGDPAERAADVSAHQALHSTRSEAAPAPAALGSGLTIHRQLINSDVEFAPVDASGQGAKAWVDRLGPGHGKGTDTNDNPSDKNFRPFAYTQMFNKATTTAIYAQGHLVNDHLGGPGNPDVSTDANKNLTAFPQKPTDQDHPRTIEDRIKTESKSRWFRYEVEASYHEAPVSRLLRRLGVTETEFDAGWGPRTGISSTQPHSGTPDHPAGIKGYEDYKKGRNGKPYTGYQPFGYRVGKANAATRTGGPKAAKSAVAKAKKPGEP